MESKTKERKGRRLIMEKEEREEEKREGGKGRKESVIVRRGKE